MIDLLLRRVCCVLLAAVLLGGCVPPVPETVTIDTFPPEAREVLRARELLDEPVVSVVGRARALVDRLDEVRHQVPRGPEQAAAAADLRADIEVLSIDVDLLELDVTSLDPAAFAGTTQAGAALVAAARDIVGFIADDLADLQPLMEFDGSLEGVVQQWDARGSRPERAEQLTALTATVDTIVSSARRLDVACSGLRENRVRWADLLAARTEELAVAAENREGNRFDELRQRYQRAPYGEDRTAADAEERPCWIRRQPLADLQGSLDEAFEQLRDSLS